MIAAHGSLVSAGDFALCPRLPQDVLEAARMRGNPTLPFQLVQEVVNDMRDGKIEIRKAFPNGTPSMLEIYQVASDRKIGSI